MAGSLLGTIVMTAISVVVPPLGMATGPIQTAPASGVKLAGAAGGVARRGPRDPRLGRTAAVAPVNAAAFRDAPVFC
jgi:hypothetical protein